MQSAASLKESILAALAQHDFLISAAGIRYGSVANVAFGKGITQEHPGRLATRQYAVELEFGADEWSLIRGEEILIDSDFANINKARDTLTALLVGRKVSDIESSTNESSFVFDDGLRLRSLIGPDPASGFLYSFETEAGLVWETLDGSSLSAD